jgi:hypothetical protein
MSQSLTNILFYAILIFGSLNIELNTQNRWIRTGLALCLAAVAYACGYGRALLQVKRNRQVTN